jgi:hypothetical protein
MKKESLTEIIDRLARQKGYPAIRLSYTAYIEVLKKAREIKYK